MQVSQHNPLFKWLASLPPCWFAISTTRGKSAMFVFNAPFNIGPPSAASCTAELVSEANKKRSSIDGKEHTSYFVSLTFSPAVYFQVVIMLHA